MATVTQTIIPDSALLGMLTKKYDFGADVYKAAFFNSSAAFTSATTAYSATNECSGTNYSAGGYTLTNVAPSASNGKATTGWQDYTAANITVPDIRWVMVYNSTVSNEAIYIMKLDVAVSKTAANFTIKFPQPAAGVAPIALVVR